MKNMNEEYFLEDVSKFNMDREYFIHVKFIYIGGDPAFCDKVGNIIGPFLKI